MGNIYVNFREIDSEARGPDLQSQHIHRDYHRALSQRQTDSNHLGNIPDIPGEGGRGEGNH